MTTKLTRREALKGAGVALSAGVSIPVLSRTVEATESGDAEVVLTGTIPSGASVDVLVEEYDTENSTEPMNTQEKTLTAISDIAVFDMLDAEKDYYYSHIVTFHGDGNTTPEVGSLQFEVPRGPEDFESTDYTNAYSWRAKPDAVTIEYDEWYLRNYQPKLALPEAVQPRYKGLYGYVARSDDQETDALCYWMLADHEKSPPGVSPVSSLGDHEPIFVFVNDQTGVVERVDYSAYQWFAGRVYGDDPSIFDTERRDEPSHAKFQVVDPWQHFRFTPGNEEAVFQELKSWPEVRPSWDRNGFYSAGEPAAIENPWAVQNRKGWWKSRTSDAILADIWETVASVLGWYGADNADDRTE